MAAMWSHAPRGYRCPFCRNISEGSGDLPLEIVHRDDDVGCSVTP